MEILIVLHISFFLMSCDNGCMSLGDSEVTVLYSPINHSREMHCDVFGKLDFNWIIHQMVRILVSILNP